MVENRDMDFEDDDDDEDDKDTELYRAIPIITGLFTLYGEARAEIIDNATVFVKHHYSRFNTLAVEIEVHAGNHIAYTSYQEEKTKLDEMYGDIDERNYQMKPGEAIKRWKNLLNLMKGIGLFQIDPRRAYYEPRPEDEIEFSGWEED